MNQKNKVLVIGCNHAGTMALRLIKKLEPSYEVIAYDMNDNISFLGCGIALWVKNEFKDPKGLFYASKELLEKEKIKIKMKHKIEKVDFKNKTVKIKDINNNKIIEDNYDKLVIASGSWPIIPNIKGINLENIKIVKWFQHAKQIKDLNLNKDIKTIAICGAGYIGVELADAFISTNKKVILIDMEKRIMPNYYDQEFTDQVQKKMQAKNITLALNEKVIEFIGKDKVKSVVTNKNKYNVDAVMWCIGFKPANDIYKKDLKTDHNDAIIVNDKMQTSMKDVYAIGDCIEVYNNAWEKNKYLPLATTAIRSAIIASFNICNKEVNSLGFSGANAISVFGLNLAGVGLNETFCKNNKIDYEATILSDNDKPEFMQAKELTTIKLVWMKKTKRLIGAFVMSNNKTNHTELIHFYSLAITKKMTIDELVLIDIFFLPHFNKPFNLITTSALKALGIEF